MVEFGVNLNNREPLITEHYSVADLLAMAGEAESLGFDSVWVGDSLLEKPRLDPLTCLGAVAGRTESVSLGTACLLSPLWNPVQLARAWTTLDQLSGGRTVMGACMGATRDPLGRQQYEVVGVPPSKRAVALREGVEVMKALWRDGSVTYDGELYQYDGVSFDTGNEVRPMRPVQPDPPVWFVSNPSARGRDAVLDAAVRRIVEVGDGWLTCCRAQHPEEYATQVAAIRDAARERGRDPDDLATAYQVTLVIGDTTEDAEATVREYIDRYYPEQHYAFEKWGPMGTAAEVIEWFETFADRGCETFILRFGAFDQQAQLRRFADEVLPAF